MFKVMIGLTRRDDMTHQDFVRWWTDEHAPMARTLPGVRRIRFNVIDDQAADCPFDGIAELWFDSEQAMVDAYASATGQAVAADSMAHVSARVRMPAHEVDVLN